jgi:hypothetical protein
MISQLRISREVISAMDPVPVAIEGKRPYHGKRQIKNQHQLNPGQKINIHGPDENIVKAMIICVYREGGILKLDYRYFDGNVVCDGTISLADYSVVRDREKEWNSKNWLEKA